MRFTDEDWIGEEKAFADVKEYLTKWEKYQPHGLSLGIYGKAQGVGKTWLATYIGRDLIRRGQNVAFVTFKETLPVYEMEYGARKEEEERLKESDVLILDEIDKPVTTPQRAFFGQRFEELIRYRTNYNKVTIHTTNLTRKQLDKEYPRTFSLLTAKERAIEIKDTFDVRRDFIGEENFKQAENEEMKPIC